MGLRSSRAGKSDTVSLKIRKWGRNWCRFCFLPKMLNGKMFLVAADFEQTSAD